MSMPKKQSAPRKRRKYTSMIPAAFADLYPSGLTPEQDQIEALKVYRVRERCQTLYERDAMRYLVDRVDGLGAQYGQQLNELRAVVSELVRRLEEGSMGRGWGAAAPPAAPGQQQYVSPPGGNRPTLKGHKPSSPPPPMDWEEEGADDDLAAVIPDGENDTPSAGVLQADVERLEDALLEHASGREDVVRALMERTIRPKFIDHGTLPPKERALDMLDQLIDEMREGRP